MVMAQRTREGKTQMETAVFFGLFVTAGSLSS